MSSQKYQEEFDSLGAQGYHPFQFLATQLARMLDTLQYGRTTPNMLGRAQHGQTATSYQASFDLNTQEGYRLVDVDAANVNGIIYYSSIWEKSSGPAGLRATD